MIRNYDNTTRMRGGFPRITKLGAVSPCGESTPFVFRDRLYRLELCDATRGVDPAAPVCALIRDRETGEVLSRLAQDCYYHSLYQEGDTVFVLGTQSAGGSRAGDTIRIFESRDLVHWTPGRTLFANPGWRYFNTSLTKGPEGYVLCLEADRPQEAAGVPFTCFFARSKDLITWEAPDPALGYPKDRYIGGPWLRWSRGYYYLITVEELPCQRYTNYIQRTRDFRTWEIGYYNPLLMPDEADRMISPWAHDLTPDLLREIRTGFLSSNSDVDLCEWQGKTLFTYNVGNQLGFYYLAEAVYDGSPDDFLAANFE